MSKHRDDHEPSPETGATDSRRVESAHVAVLDANFSHRAQHAYGHGSQEHVAEMARRRPGNLVLAAHHGRAVTDREIRRSEKRYPGSLSNYAIAVEGLRLSWNPATGRIVRSHR